MTLVDDFKPNWDQILFTDFIHPEKHVHKMTGTVRDVDTEQNLLFLIRPTKAIVPLYDQHEKLCRIIVPVIASDVEAFVKKLHTKYMKHLKEGWRYTIPLYHHCLHVDMPIVHRFTVDEMMRQESDPIACTIHMDTDIAISLIQYKFVLHDTFRKIKGDPCL